MVEMFSIGKVVNTHGIKGELRVLPTTDDMSRFKQLKTIFVENNEIKEYEIEAARLHKTFVLVKLKGIDDIDSAEHLKGSILKIKRTDSSPLKEDEYYISDLYGLNVVTEEGEELGVLDDILFSAANDVYVVKSDERTKDLLIPAIKQCIINVDIEKNVMVVRLLEGLLE
ncbi:MAG: 16S rRNA processing protein RimM [Epulopiscium sp. Nele67-Bin001]|nr:MAG: 16S rRNA processing protein RimM [Epulopiscium sp. Nuni2H_MBin001]OON90851.1 MAG: 16S rRNA processing protein RimM [Epulopiscium sp. Nele67-Bin001]